MIDVKYKKPSVPVILWLCALSLVLSSCASKPIDPKPFDGKWEIVPVTPFRSMGCLEMEDVQNLREYMLRRCNCELKR